MISLRIARPKHRLLLLGMFRVGIRRLVEWTGRITSQSPVEQNLHLIRNIFFQSLFSRYLELVYVLLFFHFRHGQGTGKYLTRLSFRADERLVGSAVLRRTARARHIYTRRAILYRSTHVSSIETSSSSDESKFATRVTLTSRSTTLRVECASSVTLLTDWFPVFMMSMRTLPLNTPSPGYGCKSNR